MKTKLFRWAVAICIGMCVAVQAQPEPAGQLAALQATAALPSEHRVLLWWCGLKEFRAGNDPTWIEIARIAGYWGIGDHYGTTDYERSVVIADAAGVPLVLNTKPYARIRQKDGEPLGVVPLTLKDAFDELQFAIDKYQRIRAIVGDRIEAVTFDMELQVEPSHEARKLFDSITALIFPNARRIWYRNGDWSHAKAFSNGLRTMAWYTPHDPAKTEEAFADMVKEFPGEEYGVWLSLGPCYMPGGDWDWTCPIMTETDWRWLRRMWASNDLITETVIFPMPGRPEATTSVGAFLAFVRGATGQPLE